MVKPVIVWIDLIGGLDVINQPFTWQRWQGN
jgi:hypothetical protein